MDSKTACLLYGGLDPPRFRGPNFEGGNGMNKKQGVACIGADVSKNLHVVSDSGRWRGSEVRVIRASPGAVRKLVRKPATGFSHLHDCHATGPTGYGSYRQILSLGFECFIVAPCLTLTKPRGSYKDRLSAAEKKSTILQCKRYPTEVL